MKTERLYDAFGELIYVLVASDGNVSGEELNTFQTILAGHAEKQSINWSFNYELERKNSPEDVFKKALLTCKELGPRHEYEFLIEILDKIAASDGRSKEEIDIISKFKYELKEEFIKQSSTR